MLRNSISPKMYYTTSIIVKLTAKCVYKLKTISDVVIKPIEMLSRISAKFYMCQVNTLPALSPNPPIGIYIYTYRGYMWTFYHICNPLITVMIICMYMVCVRYKLAIGSRNLLKYRSRAEHIVIK